jgi:hypothetical protein
MVSRSSRRSSARVSSARSRYSDVEAEEFDRTASPGQQGSATARPLRMSNAPTTTSVDSRDARRQTGAPSSTRRGRLPASLPPHRRKPRARRPGRERRERPLAERCILGFNWPADDAERQQQAQVTPTQVVILNEMVHSARVIDQPAVRIGRVDAP